MLYILFIIYLKCLSIRKNLILNEFENEKLNIIRTFFTYTSFGHLLSCILYFYNYNYLLNTSVFCILFTNTAGFWCVEYPKTKKDASVLDILSHGPSLLHYIIVQDNVTEIKLTYVQYPIILSLFWLCCIWFPWYMKTNFPIYESLSNNLSFSSKFINILKILNINCLGFILYYSYIHNQYLL